MALALPLLFLGISSGCAASRARAGERLHLASLELHDSLQFGDYRLIAQRLAPELRNTFLARAYGVEKSLSVLEMTTISVEMGDGGEEAQTLTRISWYELPSTIVKTDNIFVNWRWLGEKKGGWRIEKIAGGPLPIPED